MSLVIDTNFYGGAITVIEAKDPRNVTLALRPDTNAPDIAQWFHFRLYSAPGVPLTLKIVNAGKSAYPGGWEDYRACVSPDGGITWQRTDTSYDGQVMTISYTPVSGVTEFAYFAPFTGEDTQRMLGKALQDPRASLDVLGHSSQGQPIQRLHIREGETKKTPVWFTARQHPGETQGGFVLQGFLGRLLNAADPVSRALLKAAEFHIVADINPDGTRAGNLRTSASGANLNREWESATLDRSPEVLCVREEMKRTGASVVMDLHGDEALPYVFIVNPGDVPGMTNEQHDRRQRFDKALLGLNRDFQTDYNYPPSRPDHAAVKKLTPWATVNLGALAMTVEMPFKDNANLPDPTEGWSPDKCRRLGYDFVAALASDLVK